MFVNIVANDGMRIAVLKCREWPFCQLRHSLSRLSFKANTLTTIVHKFNQRVLNDSGTNSDFEILTEPVLAISSKSRSENQISFCLGPDYPGAAGQLQIHGVKGLLHHEAELLHQLGLGTWGSRKFEIGRKSKKKQFTHLHMWLWCVYCCGRWFYHQIWLLIRFIVRRHNHGKLSKTI